MKYDAFISYRHTPLDMEMAKKIHSALETYHIPASVRKKTGKKKIERIFRDQEELPIGSDLNDNISSALEGSEFLIVICSPDTPGSYWVGKEIDTFISLHGREHILAVLVAGEPRDSFPPQLLVDDEGNAVEPLAADVRADNPKDRKKLFKTEILRLAAPIIGCSYDDLKQRHRERILKRNITIAACLAGVVAIAGTAFGIYRSGVADRMEKLANEKSQLAEEKTQLADEKTTLAAEKSELADKMEKLAGEKSELADRMEKLADEKSQLAEEKTELADKILSEYKEKQKNQSKFYAEKALSLLEEANRSDAALVALRGLPSDENDRPYVPDAEYALSQILYAYDNGLRINYDRILPHDMGVDDMYLSEDSVYLLSHDYGHTIRVWNTEDFSLLATITQKVNDNNYIPNILTATVDSEGIYICASNFFSKYDLSGNIVFSVEFANISAAFIAEKINKVFLVKSKTITVLDIDTGKELAVIPNETEISFSGKFALSPDGKYLAVSKYMNFTDADMGHFVVIDTSDYSFTEYATRNPYVIFLGFTNENDVAAVSTFDDFYLKGDPGFSLSVFASDGNALVTDMDISAHLSEPNGFSVYMKPNSIEEKKLITIAIDTEVFTVDLTEAGIISRTKLPSNARSLDLTEGTSKGYVGYKNGYIDEIDILAGGITPGATFNTNISIRKMELIPGGMIILPSISNNLYILKQHPAVDMKEMVTQDAEAAAIGVSPSSTYYVMRESNAYVYRFYDPSGKLLYTVDDLETIPISYWFLDDLFIIADFPALRVIDPIKGVSTIYPYTDMGANASYTKVSEAPGGKYAVFWDGLCHIAVLDIENKTFIYKADVPTYIGHCAITADGGTLLVSRTGENLTVIDLASGSSKAIEDDSLRALSNSYATKFLTVSHNGEYAVIACADGNVRVLSLKSGSVLYVLPLKATTKCFLKFSADDTHLFMQGDDYVLNIWELLKDAEGNDTGIRYSGFADNLYIASYIVEDPSGFTAICNTASTLLLENESYGKVAFSEYATTYLPSDRSFVLIRNNTMYKTYYKDYKQLAAEVEKQFPDAELSAEDLVRYNIDD